MGELMGRNEYARHRGCAPNAVKKAEDDGRIAAAVVREADGRFVGIKWELADQLWVTNTDPAEAAKSGKSTEPLERDLLRSLEGNRDEPAAPSPDKDPHGYYEARAQRERFQAKQAELDYLKAIAQLVSTDELRQVGARRYRAVRDKLLNIPDRIAAVLAAEREPARVHAELTKELKRVLDELSVDARTESAEGAAERVVA